MSRYIIKAERIIEEEILNDEVDLGFLEMELAEIELDRDKVRNIRKNSQMVSRLVDRNSRVYYNYPPRTKHEVHGGYKKAVNKKARLNECQVFNLYFRFDSWIKGSGIALMCKPPEVNEEWIMLLPDDTLARIVLERQEYLRDARYLTLYQQTMDSNTHDTLVQNLNRIDLHERCAQSLIHEFGHVLHHRVFDQLNLSSPKYQYPS